MNQLNVHDGAIWFYGDHNSSIFVDFQRKYLNNVLGKFLVQKGYVNSILRWKRTERISDHSSIDSDVDSDDCSSCDEEESELSIDDENDDPSEIVTDNIIKKFDSEAKKIENKDKDNHDDGLFLMLTDELKNIGLNIPHNIKTIDLLRYINDLDKALKKSCNLGSYFKRQYDTYMHEYIYSDYSILFHGRYGGSIIIKGKIGTRDILFCYGDSIKYEIPCTSRECIRGNWNIDITKCEEKKKKGILKDLLISKNWRANRIGGLTEYPKPTNFIEDKFLERCDTDFSWINSISELGQFLGLEEIPKHFLDSLFKTFN